MYTFCYWPQVYQRFFLGGLFAKVAKDVVVIKCENPPADTAGDDMVGLVWSWFLCVSYCLVVSLFVLFWFGLSFVLLRLIFSDDLS